MVLIEACLYAANRAVFDAIPAVATSLTIRGPDASRVHLGVTSPRNVATNRTRDHGARLGINRRFEFDVTEVGAPSTGRLLLGPRGVAGSHMFQPQAERGGGTG